MIILDDYSPIVVGDTAGSFKPTFQYGDGSAVNLTGATLTMTMRDVGIGTLKVCTGVWTLGPDPTTGQASYAYSALDVAIAGTWELSITLTIAGKAEHADKKILVIEPT